MDIFQAVRGSDIDRERYVNRAALLFALHIVPDCTITGVPVRPDNAVAVIIPILDGAAESVSVFHAEVWDVVGGYARKLAAAIDADALVIDGRDLYAYAP
ncbi:hypothetical protein ACIODS_27920 [Micromonospora chalcea]|uniref:hypothetical protein n=1 Tax=Micromonospora chalcea TaxID=1874 RepID=UPI0038069124